MDKNWLIRTRSNHILGPISKEKVLELYNNGSVKPDDEVCSGNGFWFFIRENEMVERYLFGQDVQGFNPISEAKDVLTIPTVPSSRMSGQYNDDITIVGGLNLSMLKEPAIPHPSVIPPDQTPALNPVNKEITPPEIKKKDKLASKAKVNPKKGKTQFKKQNYLKYLGILGFILLLFLVYFRKTVIRTLFEHKVTYHSISLISTVYAQEIFPVKKKRIIDNSITLEQITFKPLVNLNGFNVISSFEIDQLECNDLKNEIYQLGIILHPLDLINEKFLIKMRDCILKLNNEHVLKRWMKWVGRSKVLTRQDQEKKDFIVEIINSPFNLITEIKVRNQIIDILPLIPEKTIAEKILKSYLFLIIGNITRSDNILRQIIQTPPRLVWAKSDTQESEFHKLANDLADKIFLKISRHPTDRNSFQLFSLYVKNFCNDDFLLKIVDSVDSVDMGDVKRKINLKYINAIAPAFVDYLKLSEMNESLRFRNLRKMRRYPLNMQSYWVWPFLDIDPLISEKMLPELLRLEKEDEIWFIYLMDYEKLADLYSSNRGKSFLPARRPYLKNNLAKPQLFMLSLYKLIDLGDISSELVNKTIDHLMHE